MTSDEAFPHPLAAWGGGHDLADDVAAAHFGELGGLGSEGDLFAIG